MLLVPLPIRARKGLQISSKIDLSNLSPHFRASIKYEVINDVIHLLRTSSHSVMASIQIYPIYMYIIIENQKSSSMLSEAPSHDQYHTIRE